MPTQPQQNTGPVDVSTRLPESTLEIQHLSPQDKMGIKKKLMKFVAIYLNSDATKWAP